MKTIVSVQEIAELEIKPSAEVAEWRKLVEQELASRWSKREQWISVRCPCCGTEPGKPTFEKLGIEYAECPTCGTLYAPRRPNDRDLASWYRDSAASRFWRERLLPASEEARLEKIVRPRAQWVMDGIAEYVPDATRLIDVSLSGRALLEEVASQSPALTTIVAAGAAADLEGPGSARISVRPTPTHKLRSVGAADVITALDALDRASDMKASLDGIQETLEPGGILLATLPVASGFEVQSLWEQSSTVIPPDKINLPSVDGLMRVFSAPRWELLELSTPGMFDVEIVRRAITSRPNAPWPRVLRALVAKADEPARQALTEYLQSQRLTSFARVIARRRS